MKIRMGTALIIVKIKERGIQSKKDSNSNKMSLDIVWDLNNLKNDKRKNNIIHIHKNRSEYEYILDYNLLFIFQLY